MALNAPHRFTLDDVAPPPRATRPDGQPLRARDALAVLEDRGLGSVSGQDLELYRLVLSPVEYKRFLSRLDNALRRHVEEINRSTWTEPSLPFGTDIADQARRERWARGYIDGPDGGRFPATWRVETEIRLPGRMKLVKGREFSVVGVRGRLRFRHAVTTDYGEQWIDGWDTEGRCRSVHPDRIRVVHAKAKTRPLRERLS